MLDGFVLSTDVAVVVELQLEVSFPPNERERSTRTKWVTALWGCVVPLYDGEQLQQGRLSLELRHAAPTTPSPLSREAPVGGVAVLQSGGLKSELELKASATWKETLQAEKLASSYPETASYPSHPIPIPPHYTHPHPNPAPSHPIPSQPSQTKPIYHRPRGRRSLSSGVLS